ncbi:glycosyl transferase [Panacibacter ginsenosidivorans]|uniref:Glycosyl transferase n=1 Tax=Panacibacter ginsenosidivorans TaxID=1813871 RepID=A0A5B8VAF4_9BACT|nr:glycosyltransferase family protein [Panacibacter ginsenosidivorans]QEC68249.1 glycosyl transferase [Panacibacter ginsenosidivorans]
MKIFYAVQATGNGHIARAAELLPFLQRYGTVDIFLSGSNSDLQTALPVKFRSRGLSLFYHKNGGLDYWRMLKELNVVNAYKDAKRLPVEKYDVVINDFESITSLACRQKKIPSISFGHQASFQSDKTPRPLRKDPAGEFILKKFATATNYIGLHFEQYDDFIYNPVIKNDILAAEPADKGHITVYLSHYADEVVAPQLHKVKDTRFEVFSKKVKQVTVDKHITFIPISNHAFNESMINCTGIITGAGFETPAEALYLGKKLLCLPIKGQYEQLCNAEALKNFDVPVVNGIDENFSTHVNNWLQNDPPYKLLLTHTIEEIVSTVMHKAIHC